MRNAYVNTSGLSMESFLGGWPRLNSEKRLWVAHPCGFCKGGVFLLSLFKFLFSSWGMAWRAQASTYSEIIPIVLSHVSTN